MTTSHVTLLLLIPPALRQAIVVDPNAANVRAVLEQILTSFQFRTLFIRVIGIEPPVAHNPGVWEALCEHLFFGCFQLQVHIAFCANR